MNEIIQFLADLLSKAEFWSMSTLGVGLTSVFSLLWVRRGNLALIASNVLQKGLKEEITSLHASEIQMQSTLLSQEQQISQLKGELALLNQNIYILSQAANIGTENKEAISRNYLSINKVAPQVKVAEVTKNVDLVKVSQEIETIKKQSSLDDLLKKI